MNIPIIKKHLRIRLRQVRRNFIYKKEANQQITHQLISLLENRKAQKIGLYYPMASEVSLLLLAEELSKAHPLALPKISPDNHMYFTPWQWGETLYKDAYDIPAPQGIKEIIPSIICVPLLGFSAAKYRLGQGGGYYDKYMQRHKDKNILWLGVAFECQKLQDMPLEKHDRKLDMIITEKQIYT